VADRDIRNDDGRAPVESYAGERGWTLPERQQRLEDASERRSMAGILGLFDDDPALDELRSAGFRTATVGLVDLVPLVEVAWADGSITPRERDVITAAAARRRLVYGGAHTQLSLWLKERPPAEVFDASRRTLRRVLQRLPPEARSNASRHLVDECSMVASASGGLLGWGTAGAAEQQLIDSMARELAQA
jgi:hypothetical protein